MSTVLVTGASGFLGVHTTDRLLETGHRVRALVRSEERLWANLRPVGVEHGDPRVEVAVGDMTDAAAVDAAVTGCDLVVHAAATFSYRRKDAVRMREDNARGAGIVLDAAAGAGCRGIVHVSSTVALSRKDAVLDHRSPLGLPLGPYSRSKVESERLARERQEAGAPIAIVNPGGVLGPHDPYLGESDGAVRDILLGRLPTWPRGCLQWVDVRDVADVVVAALAHPGGRFVVPGENVETPHVALRELTGRRLPCAVLPASLLAAAATPGYVTGWSFLPGAAEGVRLMGLGCRVDASHTVAELGVTGRPLHESLRDTVRWLVDSGRLSAKQAGRALA